MTRTLRYRLDDWAAYINVLRSTEISTALRDGDLMLDPPTFMAACQATAEAVPMDNAPGDELGRMRYIKQRLAEALEYRNAWYRAHLPAEGTSRRVIQ